MEYEPKASLFGSEFKVRFGDMLIESIVGI